MIILKNYQRSLKIDTTHLKRVVENILIYLAYQDFDISIVFVNKQRMQEYNVDFKSIRKPTDILSFGFHADLKAGERIVAHNADEKYLGDIILCPVYIQETLEQWDMSFEQRLEHLIIHGICHVLGYDHEHDEDYIIMKSLEESILSHLNNL